jgi:hypothetical protein
MDQSSAPPRKDVHVTAIYGPFKEKWHLSRRGETQKRILDDVRRRFREEIANSHEWHKPIKHLSFQDYDEAKIVSETSATFQLAFDRPISLLSLKFDPKSPGTYFMLDSSQTLDAQRQIIVPYLRDRCPGVPAGFLFDVPGKPDVTDKPVSELEHSDVIVSHSDCHPYYCVRDSAARLVLVPDNWSTWDFVNLYRQRNASEGNVRFLVRHGKDWREIQPSKTLSVKDECPDRTFRVLTHQTDYKTVVANLPSGSTLIVHVPKSRPTAKETLSAQRLLFDARPLTDNETYVAKTGRQFLAADFDLTTLGKDPISILRVAKKFRFHVDKSWSEISESDKKALTKLRFKPFDDRGQPLTAQRVKDRIRSKLKGDSQFSLFFEGRELADDMPLYLIPNPDGTKGTIKKFVDGAPTADFWRPPEQRSGRARLNSRLQVIHTAVTLDEFEPESPRINRRSTEPAFPVVRPPPAPIHGRISDVSEYEEEDEPDETRVMVSCAVSNGSELTLACAPKINVGRAKRTLAREFLVSRADVQIIFRGRILGDSILLSRLPFESGEKVNVFLRELSEIMIDWLEVFESETEKKSYVFRGIGGEFTFEFDCRADIGEVRERIAPALKLKPIQIVVNVAGVALREYELLEDVASPDRVFGYAIVSETVATYVALIREGDEPGNMEERKRIRE